MPGHLIALDNQTDVCPVNKGTTWRRLFSHCVLKFTGPEAINTFQDDQLCARLKVVIDGAVHGTQDIWDSYFPTED